MSPEDARAFTDRRWDLVDGEKLVARAERFWREGPEGCARAAQRLRDDAHAQGIRGDRAADLRRHIAWRNLLDRIESRVLARRR